MLGAVGLWLAAPWGAVVWLTSGVSLIVIDVFFSHIFGGQTVLVKRFLEAGLDVNARDMQRQTALHQAAQAGHGDVVRLLLAHGANPAFTDVSGSTALALAEKRKAEEVAKLLRAGPPK